MTASDRKPILIAGGGVSALLLAKRLKRSGIPFVVFERDASMTFRAQGYRLRLSDKGLDAIEDALGPEDFKEFWDVCSKTGGGELRTLNAITGEIIEAKPPTQNAAEEQSPKSSQERLTSRGGKTVGIARGEMRRLFMKGCEEHVKFSHKVTGYEVTETGVHAVFADGSKSVEGDMLVGGEGIYSHVARQVSNGAIKTYDTLARGLHGQAPTTAFKGLGEGVWSIRDESRPQGNVFIITNIRPGDKDDPNIVFGWTMGAQPGVIKAPNDDYSIIGKTAAEMAKSLTDKWHPSLKPLFEQMIEQDAAFWRITCSSPSGVPHWKSEPRVSVVGDAVHSMTPAGGIGANTAVRDSALLGKLIAEAGGYREGLTAEYENLMRAYASEAVGISYSTAERQFGVKIDEQSSPTVW